MVQVWLINCYGNLPPLIRIWFGPLPLWMAQLHQQIIFAISLYNIMLILVCHHSEFTYVRNVFTYGVLVHVFMQEYVLVKYIYACKLRSPGSHLDDLLLPFMITFNILLSLMALAAFIMLDTWPAPIRISILSGIDPKHIEKQETMLNPEVIINTCGSLTVLTGVLTSISIYRERSKIEPKTNNKFCRDARTGLPIQPKAQPSISLTLLMVTSALIMCFVMVPLILSRNNVTDPEVWRESEVLSLIYGCLTLFGFAVIAFLVLPALVFASNAKLRIFAVRKIKCLL